MTFPVAVPQRVFFSALLVSWALIVLQVSFTRLVSYRLFYHFVFLAISLSLLGLCAAAAYVAVRRASADLDGRIYRWLVTLVVSVPIGFLLLANPFGLPVEGARGVKLMGPAAVAYIVWCSPIMVWLNFCGGVVLASLFSRYSDIMGKLYAQDLFGAGLGSIYCLAMMKYGSPPIAFLSSSLVVFPLLWPYHGVQLRQGIQRWLGSGLAIVALILTAIVVFGDVRLRNFDNFHGAGDARPVTSQRYEWNHLFRTDLIRNKYVLDGDASTNLARWSEAASKRPVLDPAYVLAPKQPRVGIIGVGGGDQLLQARQSKAKEIFAVDINPTIIDWALGKDKTYNGGLYESPEIDVVIGEGRHAIRSAGRQFDLLVMYAIDTYSAAASGAYALTENFLYTQEAFEDFYGALSDDGVMSVARWLFQPPRENLRLFATAIAALQDMGLSEPQKHVAMLAPVRDYERMGMQRVWGRFLLSKKPFDAESIARLQAHLEATNWSILYAPGLATDTAFASYADPKTREDFVANYPYILKPATDASPYFFQYFNPLDGTSFGRFGDFSTTHVYQSSSVMLLTSLAIAFAFSLLLIIAPLYWSKRQRTTAIAFGWRDGVFFTGLGIGFMAFEVPVIQVMSLYLGHPTYGFSVVLVGLLISSGIGSFIVHRTGLVPWKASALVALIVALVAVILLPLVHGTINLPDFMRFAITLLLVVTCGVPMGFPLALGIRRLGEYDPQSVAWAWGVNGAASVVGACVVMIVMVFSGSPAALAVGAVCYGAGALALMSSRDEAESSP